MRSVSLADDLFKVIANNVASDAKTAFNIRIVLSELFSNAFLYGDKQSGNAMIEFKGCFTKDKFVASIINDGGGFADNTIEWNTFPSLLEESGRGIKIIKKLCDKLEFRKHGNNKFEAYIEISMGTREQHVSKAGGCNGYSETV